LGDPNPVGSSVRWLSRGIQPTQKKKWETPQAGRELRRRKRGRVIKDATRSTQPPDIGNIRRCNGHSPSGFWPIALMLSCQQSGQGASERLHNTEKRISTKTRNHVGDQVKEELAEVKMSMIRKRSHDNQEKTSQTMT